MSEVRELIDTELDAVDVRELIDAELDAVCGGGIFGIIIEPHINIAVPTAV
jgi:hypothetical protein